MPVRLSGYFKEKMKTLIFAILLCASSVWASPFLVCDPSTDLIGGGFEVWENSKLLYTSDTETDGSIKMELKNLINLEVIFIKLDILRIAKPATLRLPYSGVARPLPRIAHRATGAQAWAEAMGSVARTGSVEVPVDRLGDYAVARRSGSEPTGGRLVCWVTGSDRGIGSAHVEITAGSSVASPVAASAAGASEHEGLQPGSYAL